MKALRILRDVKYKYFMPSWPKPKLLNSNINPTYLFIFTPPYSGSTALAKVLNSSSSSMLLRKDGEGQWLVPGLCSKDRWSHDMYVDWHSVKLVWHNRFVKFYAGQKNIIIEKSPANLMRYAAFLREFPNHKIITFNRNPYANCASSMYRHHDADKLTDSQRLALLANYADQWIMRSAVIRKISEECPALMLTYEQFCDRHQKTLDRISNHIPELGNLNSTLEVKVKDYPKQGIKNQNNRQIAKLKASEVEMLTKKFTEELLLLNYFNYDLI